VRPVGKQGYGRGDVKLSLKEDLWMEDAKKIKDIMVPIEEYEKVNENDALCLTLYIGK
jgi:hypothetical protein